MPTATVYAHGFNMGQAGRNDTPPPRGLVTGWSEASIRRNRNFLYAVDVDALKACPGLALTLTVRDLPPTAAEWSRLRDNFLFCLRREGFAFLHWLTEFQLRRVPHLHMAVFLLPGSSEDQAIRFAGAAFRHWLRLAAPYNASPKAQYMNLIYDALGWNQYQSKHAARGLHHYQRSQASLPPSWRGASAGRMWGKLGNWPLCPEFKLQLDLKAFAFMRRVIRSWRLADARQALLKAKRPQDRQSAIRRIRSARRMLLCPDRRLSSVRGISEWLPQKETLRVLALASSLGYQIES